MRRRLRLYATEVPAISVSDVVRALGASGRPLDDEVALHVGDAAVLVPVRIAWVRQHLGGRRPWFVCPVCGRRAGKLYPDPSGSPGLACRRCCGYTYRSWRLSGNRSYQVARRLLTTLSAI